jgi:hypothetical protein
MAKILETSLLRHIPVPNVVLDNYICPSRLLTPQDHGVQGSPATYLTLLPMEIASLNQASLSAVLSHHLLAVISLDGRILDANPLFLEVVGPISGNPSVSGLESSLGLHFQAHLSDLKAGKTCKLEATSLSRPSRQAWLLPVLSPLFGEPGIVTRVLFSATGMVSLFSSACAQKTFFFRYNLGKVARGRNAQPTRSYITFAVDCKL